MGEKERSFFTEFSDDIETVSKQILEKNKDKGALANVLYGGGLSPLNMSTEEAGDDDLEWRNLYYRKKFNHELDDKEFHKKLQTSYLEALYWVANYYYHGCVSWSWYYPYHYTPLAIGTQSDLPIILTCATFVDLVDYENFVPSFKLDYPFRPLQQLLGVLPLASKELLPVPYQKLMLDVGSPLNKFYPVEFDLDMEGKKQAWEAIVLIP